MKQGSRQAGDQGGRQGNAIRRRGTEAEVTNKEAEVT